MSKPIIWYFANSTVPSVAANSVHVVFMCEALESIEGKVTIFSPSESLLRSISYEGFLKNYGVNLKAKLKYLVKPKFKGGGALYRLQFFLRLILQRPEYVYGRCHEGCLVSARIGVPTALELHHAVWQKGEYHYNRFLSFVNSKGFRGVVVISDALKQDLISEFPALFDHVYVAHDAARDFGYSSLPERHVSSRLQVYYSGSLHPGKGMEIISELASRCNWADFNVVGGDDDSINKWRAISGSNVCFLGYKPASEVSKILTKSDVLIAPYLKVVNVHGGGDDVGRWMSPLKIFEYMAANRPIIASDIPILHEVLSHKKNALLACPDDMDEWVAALFELRDNYDLAASLASQARKEFEDSYTWKHRATNIMNFLGWLPVGK